MGVILTSARSMARDGVLSSKEVGQIVAKALAKGTLNPGQVKDLKEIVTTFGPQLTPDAKKAIGAILSAGAFTPNLEGQLHGLSSSEADVLEKQGIKSEAELLLRARTPIKRAQLATASGLSEPRLLQLTELADLSRARRVGTVAAALIHGAGTKNLPALAAADPATLRRDVGTFMLTPEGQAISRRRPSLPTITKWIDDAKTHPLLLQYPGATQPSFTKAQFESLSNDDRAALLFGQNVIGRGGAAFSAGDITVDIGDPTTPAIKAKIDALVANSLDYSYDSAVLADEGVEVCALGNDVIGYVVTFEVASEAHHEDTTGTTGGGGTVRVAFDDTGKVLGQSEDWYPGGHE
jgi:hypothetical protein